MADPVHEHEHEHENDEGYSGPAVLTVDGRDVPVHARLDARHEPQDGRLHWFGRVRVAGGDEGGAPDLSGGHAELRTDGGRAPAHIGEVDPWGRYRVTGVGTPPFRLDEPDLDD